MDIVTLHCRVYSVSNVPKLRSFQYRLLQHALVTNVNLYRWKIASTDLCFFCQQQKETILHLLIYCSSVQQLWRDLKNYLETRFQGVTVHIQPKKIVKNEIVESRNNVCNLICLVTKQFIYAQRCLGKKLHFPVLKQRILHVQSVEKYIAQKNGKMAKHIKKWEILNIGRSQGQYIEEYINDM